MWCHSPEASSQHWWTSIAFVIYMVTDVSKLMMVYSTDTIVSYLCLYHRYSSVSQSVTTLTHNSDTSYNRNPVSGWSCDYICYLRSHALLISLVLPLPRTRVPYRFSYAIESGLILLLCDECFPVLASRVYTFFWISTSFFFSLLPLLSLLSSSYSPPYSVLLVTEGLFTASPPLFFLTSLDFTRAFSPPRDFQPQVFFFRFLWTSSRFCTLPNFSLSLTHTRLAMSPTSKFLMPRTHPTSLARFHIPTSVAAAQSWYFAILVNKLGKIPKIFEQLDHL